MNLNDLFAKIHSDNMRRRFQFLVGVFVAGLLLLVGAAIDGENHRAEDDWTCWAERNDALPEGVEIVAYPQGITTTSHPKPGVMVKCP